MALVASRGWSPATRAGSNWNTARLVPARSAPAGAGVSPTGASHGDAAAVGTDCPAGELPRHRGRPARGMHGKVTIQYLPDNIYLIALGRQHSVANIRALPIRQACRAAMA